jgi:hypothetical protein
MKDNIIIKWNFFCSFDMIDKLHKYSLLIVHYKEQHITNIFSNGCNDTNKEFQLLMPSIVLVHI